MTLLAAVLCLTGARAQQALPYDYGFEDNNLTADGWVLQGATSPNTGINAMASQNGNYGFRFSYSEQSAYLLSPILSGTENGVTVTFSYKDYTNEYGDEQFQVGYTTDETVTDASEFTYGAVLTASMSWLQYESTFPAGTKRIAVKYIYSDCFYLLLDDFSFTVPSACKRPSGLTVSEVTNESAVISWTSDATSFDIEVNGEVTENVSNPYTLTQLKAGTVYEVRVRTNCGGGEVSDWTNVASFTTLFCDESERCAISYEFTDDYGDGWNGNAINVVDELTGVVLATWTITSGRSASGSLAVCDGRDISFQWVIGSYPGECSYTVYDVNGEEIFSGSGQLSSAVSYTVNCTVEQYKKPVNLTATEIGPHSAVLSWTERGDATEWVVNVYDNTEDDSFGEFTTTDNPYTLTGLNADSEYMVVVRPSGENEAWSDVVIFTTFFPVPAAVTASNVTTSSADISWTADADATGADLQYGIATIQYNEYKYDNGTMGTQINAQGSPFDYAIMLPAGSYSGNVLTKVSVFDYAASAETITETITIYNDGTTAPEGEIASKPLTLTGSRSFVEVSFDDIVFDATKNLWIVVSNNSGNAVPAAADNLNDANGRWTALGGSWGDLAALGVPGYVWMIHAEIKSADTSSTEWTTVNGVTSPYQLTGLADGTSYAVQVRSTYVDGYSEWRETAFTTISNNPLATNVVAEALHTTATISWEGESESYKVKYREASKLGEPIFIDDFENGLDQWTIVTAGEGPGWVISDETGGNAATAYSYDNDTYTSFDADNWLISPQVQLGGTLMFTAANAPSYPDSYEVLLSTAGTDIADFTTTLKAMSTATGNITIDLSAYAGQTGYIAIHHVSYDCFLLVIDDFSIYGADIPAGEWQEVAADETSVELTGLEMGTEYDYTVIGIKGGSENAGTAVKSFTTLSENDKIFTTAGNWDEDENWTPAGVPTATSNLIIRADAVVPAGVIATANNVTIDGGSITIKDGGELKQNSDIKVTLEKNIAGYGDGEGKFSLISSPVADELLSTDIEGLLEDNYDYYRFVRTMNLEWRSYQLTSFNLTPGNGALYANKEDKVLKFTGETWPSVDNYLSMDVTYNANYPLNVILAGNPFPCTGTIYFMDNYNNTSGYIYKLNAAGDGFDVYYGFASVAPGEAVLVEYGASGTIFYESEDYGDGPALDADDYIVLPQHGVMDTNPDAGPVIPFADNATNNGEYIAAFNGKSIIAKLDGRTLYKDGKWNTICLPFNVTLASSPLAGATAKTLTAATMTGTTVSLTFGDAVDVLQANVPYIIKWNSGENIVNPSFPYVTIANADEDARTVSLADGNVKFVGYYDAFDITADDDNIYYMGSGNTLQYTGVDRTLKAFRAYFDFTENAASRQFILDFGDGNTTTGIAGVADDSQKDGEWYTVDGMKLDKQPTRKGLYINNGKKMVIK